MANCNTIQKVETRFPVLFSFSWKHLYTVYLLHLSGATSDNLDKYKTNALNAFSFCKDDGTLSISTGCQIVYEVNESYYCGAAPNATNTECYWEGGGTASMCCRYWPNNRVGSKAWPWNTCV